MGSFQAKIGRKMQRRKLSFRSVPTRHEIENSKKFQKLKNTIMASFQAKIGW